MGIKTAPTSYRLLQRLHDTIYTKGFGEFLALSTQSMFTFTMVCSAHPRLGDASPEAPLSCLGNKHVSPSPLDPGNSVWTGPVVRALGTCWTPRSCCAPRGRLWCCRPQPQVFTVTSVSQPPGLRLLGPDLDSPDGLAQAPCTWHGSVHALQACAWAGTLVGPSAFLGYCTCGLC